MDEQRYGWPELGLTDLADLVWEGRLVVVLVTVVTLAVGAILYFVLPPRYQSVVEVTPMTGARFSSFAGLKEANSFDYTRDTLLAEYAKYLTDRDLLGTVEQDTGAEDVDVKFDLELPKPGPTPQPVDEPYSIRMTARHGDKKALDNFVSEALTRASRNLAEGLRLEVERKVAAFDEKKASEVRRLEVEIEGKRAKLKAERADSIEKLSGQASVARSVGMDKPLELQAQSLTVDLARGGGGVSAVTTQPMTTFLPLLPQPPAPAATETPAIPLPQVSVAPRPTPSDYPGYFNGYLAIEEQLKLLKSRRDDDAFIPELRDLQEQIYVLKNDPVSDHIRRLLAQSMLNDPQTAVMASYSLAGAESKKSFPRASIFAPVILGLGLIFGMCLAILRGVRKMKRNLQASAPVAGSAS